MSVKHCPIRNPNIEESDLLWDLCDKAECYLEPEGVAYKITVEAFKRIASYSTHGREKLTEWVLKQHSQGKNVPEITTDTLVSLGLSST